MLEGFSEHEPAVMDPEPFVKIKVLPDILPFVQCPSIVAVLALSHRMDAVA